MTSVNGGLNISYSIGQGERHFLDRSRAGLSNMIPADTDGIPLRKALVTECEYIGDYSHGGSGWKYVCAREQDIL